MNRLIAVFVGVGSLALASYAQSPPALSVQVSNGLVRLRITGDAGTAGTIQWATNFYGADNWHALTNLIPLSSSPVLVADTNVVTSRRFYRAFAVPANTVPANMVWIAPGTFDMGSPASELGRELNEILHTVRLTKGFYMGQYAVTQGEYLALMGNNPSFFTTTDYYHHPISEDLSRPVDHVSWTDATSYCATLTQQERSAGRLLTNWVYRLPTESEREYACRAGTTTAFHYGDSLHGGMANFDDHYEYDAAVGDILVANPAVGWLPQTTTVASYPPNDWGLYDMHGNIWEWCRDWFGTYPATNLPDPQGPPTGSYRVVRGGCWHYYARYCRSAYRYYDVPTDKSFNIGFRVVLAQGQP